MSEFTHNDRGSAVAEFVMVSALTLMLAFAVFQLAFALHIRVTLIDCAGEGARAAAALGADTQTGVERTRSLISSAVNADYAQDVTASVVERDGLQLVAVTVKAPLPLLGYLRPSENIEVTGHAIIEEIL